MSQAKSQKLTSNIKAAGCAAKISSAELAQIVGKLSPVRCPELLAGTEHFEDAAVYQLTEDQALIFTIDFFPPVIEDPFLYGRIAATNAISDVWAMGGRPVLALNVFGFPTCDLELSLAEQIIAGGSFAASEAGVVLAGGHSIQTREPIYGMAVAGLVHPKKILTNGGALTGDALLVTKPLGTGIALLGEKGEMLSTETYQKLVDSLCKLNGPCLDIALKYPLHACTDVTGFGLVGHLHEMSDASGLSCTIDHTRVPVFDEVKDLAEQGFVPAGAYANRKSAAGYVRFADSVAVWAQDLLFDPQTSGGLMFALPADLAGRLCEDLEAAGWTAATIGMFENGDPGQVEVI